MNQLKPEVAQWYFRRDRNEKFEVVSVEEDGTVEIQNADGNLDEMDAEGWLALSLEAVGPPEDLEGILDIVQDEADGGDPTESEGSLSAQPMRAVDEAMDEQAEQLESSDDASDDEDADINAEAFIARVQKEERGNTRSN